MEGTIDNRIQRVNIEDEMKTAYIDYSMSVIVSRALPDVRDGLKPVHRRVLFGMHELGVAHNKAFKKSARIVGEVLGKYHPHGDTSVYDAMVRMAQDWSLRYLLVDGQGNFGSVDGDSPAAMRYTEARLKRISSEILSDIDKDTVDFRLNFDDSLEEPTVLPTRIPTLLVNGASGIAVGMATNMLPHNLTEVIDATVAYIDDNQIDIKGLMQFVKAPDFPTGGTIYGTSGIIQAYNTGRGRVVVRAKAEIEETKTGRYRILVYEIPYQVNKANLIAKTASLINDKKIEGISDIRDESDRKGMRIVYELKKDANPHVVLNQLYKNTALQSSYGINNICLVNGRPRLLNLKEIIKYFVEFRNEVIVRRTQYELRKAKEKAHILIGLLIALDYIDAIISLIRNSKTPEEARNGLINGDFIDNWDDFKTKYSELILKMNIEGIDTHIVGEGKALSEAQARAILDMRLQKLTGLERDKVRKDYDDLMLEIDDFEAILGNKERQLSIVKDELAEVKERYGDERRTDITIDDSEINIEDIIDDEPVALTISHLGYIKRTPLNEYREQGRGGRGSRGASTRSDDFTEQIFVATAHNYLLFFTRNGRCFWKRVYQIPEGLKTAKGRAIQNLIQLPQDDKVLACIVVKDLKDEEFLDNHFIVFTTKNGVIKKTSLRDYSRPRSNGINAIIIREGDELLECKLTDGNSIIVLASKYGKAIRFPEAKVRSMGRNSAGVRGMDLSDYEDNELVGMVCLSEEEQASQQILVVSENGYGKRSVVSEYRETNRGGKGVKTINVTDKTGKLCAVKGVADEHGLMIINKSGITIRLAVNTISSLGRATQGVKLIRLGEEDSIASVARIDILEAEEEDVNEALESTDENASEVSNEAPENNDVKDADDSELNE